MVVGGQQPPRDPSPRARESLFSRTSSAPSSPSSPQPPVEPTHRVSCSLFFFAFQVQSLQRARIRYYLFSLLLAFGGEEGLQSEAYVTEASSTRVRVLRSLLNCINDARTNLRSRCSLRMCGARGRGRWRVARHVYVYSNLEITFNTSTSIDIMINCMTIISYGNNFFPASFQAQKTKKESQTVSESVTDSQSTRRHCGTALL